jgi:hypothetical protein
MVDEETLDADPDLFLCDECPIIEQLQALDPFNAQVWNLYRQIVTRLASDLHAGSAIVERLTRDMTRDEFEETWRRLVLLYDTLQPPPPMKGS